MPNQNLVQWRQKLENAIKNNAATPHTRFFQLATVDRNAAPACRTLVFRGFMDNANTLIAHTDVRSEKIQQLKNDDRTAVCWYFCDTREQFRLTSKVTLITGQQQDAADIRWAHWQALSQSAQASYSLATPGSALVIEPAASEKPNCNAGLGSKPSKNFALLLIVPSSVDHLLLAPSPQQRSRYHKQQDGHWSVQRVIA